MVIEIGAPASLPLGNCSGPIKLDTFLGEDHTSILSQLGLQFFGAATGAKRDIFLIT